MTTTIIPYLAARSEVYGLVISKEGTSEGEYTGHLRPGELVLLGIYWYHVRDDGCLTPIGKTKLYRKSSMEARMNPSDDDVRADAAALTDTDIRETRPVMHVTLRGAHIELMRLSELYRPGTQEGEPAEGDYCHLSDALYEVQGGGKLKPLGAYHTETFEDLAAGFTRLTGHILKDFEEMIQQSGRVLHSEADIERMFRAMSEREQQRFLQECARMFGPPSKN